MTTRQDRFRKTGDRKLNQAVAPVIEVLEDRRLLSAAVFHTVSYVQAHSHHGVHQSSVVFSTPPKSTGSPVLAFPSGTIRETGKTPSGISPAQIKHLYGVDQLDAYDPNFPLFTNIGNGETIIVIGAPAEFLNDVPMGRKSNINIFSSQFGLINTSVIPVPIPGFTPNPLFLQDSFGAVETTMQLEWAHAMAPAANIELVEVPSVDGVVSAADLQAGIQTALSELQLQLPGPINQFGPGGVVTSSLATVGEDSATAAQFDALFSQASAKDVSFIFPTGDFGGTISLPAASPFVTAVGGTQYRIDATGNRIYESASLRSGGGQSFIEPLPAFQQGVKIGKHPLPSRAVPDISLISETQGSGVAVYYDPTLMNNSNIQWYTEEGTSVSAPIFTGMVADANELRKSFGELPIGNQLNAKLYEGFHLYPKLLYTDVIQGNNVLHPALRGFDLATGMGTPKANNLIPYLAGTVGSVSSNVKFFGTVNSTFSQAPVTITTYVGTGMSKVGPQYLGLSLNLKAVRGAGALASTPFNTANVTIDLISRNGDNSAVGTGTATVTTTTPSTGTGIPITSTTTYNIQFVGRVRGKATVPRVSGIIFTVDGFGNRIQRGIAETFEGTITS
jgi:subtilase family serine protease